MTRPRRIDHRLRSTRSSTLLLSSLAGFALLLAANGASARTELVTWTHVMPCSVDAFQIRYGSPGSALDRIVDVGLPRQAGGHFSYPLYLSDSEVVSVCVAAIRGSETSACSQPLTLDPSAPHDSPSVPAPAEDSRIWCDDFLSGAVAADWVSTGAGSSLSEVPGLFAVQDLGAQNPALVTSSPLAGIHTHFLGHDVEGLASSQWNQYEYSGQMRFSNDSLVGVTMYSRFRQAARYYRLARQADGEFRLDRSPANSSFRCDQAATGVRPVADAWYAFRVRVDDTGVQTNVEAKVWRADQREPDGFTARCSEGTWTNRLTSGAIGVWSSGAGLKAWDSLSVSVLEEPASGDPLGIPGRPELSP